jgi:hypothetical protein
MTAICVSDLVATHAGEVRRRPRAGIAGVAVDYTNGAWAIQHRPGGLELDCLREPRRQTPPGCVPDDARVRVVPNQDYYRTVAYTAARSWRMDQTSGNGGRDRDVTSNGGISAFSAATARLRAITVKAVNEPRRSSPTPADQIIFEDADLVFSSGNGTLISIADLDVGRRHGPARV